MNYALIYLIVICLLVYYLFLPSGTQATLNSEHKCLLSEYVKQEQAAEERGLVTALREGNLIGQWEQDVRVGVAAAALETRGGVCCLPCRGRRGLRTSG